MSFSAGAAEAPVARAERLLGEARGRHRQSPTNTTTAWEFARACFDLAEFATNNTQRADLANQGIAACRAALTRDPKSTAAEYYLGLNLGQLARTKLFSALGLLDEMETAWTRAIVLDEKFDYAGPHRSLGLLYQDAPGWPTSLGSRAKARLHLQKAADLCPDFPDNRLCLLEAWLKWGEKKKALADLPAVETVLREARKKLTGDEWALSWQDWDRRWGKVRAKAGAEPLRTPRGK